MMRRRSWRSSRPPAALISACASCAQAIDEGPQMPAEPLIGHEQADDEIGAVVERLRGARAARRARRGDGAPFAPAQLPTAVCCIVTPL